jgi:outer membrane protein W
MKDSLSTREHQRAMASNAPKPSCCLVEQGRPPIVYVVLLVTILATGAAHAEVGVQVGPHGGVALGSDVDPYVGLDLRLTAPSSPLTIQPTFEYVFDENQTLYHIGGNLLYEVPLAFRLKPYFGVGVNYSTFALNEPNGPTMTVDEEQAGDDQGHRLGMNLLAGARLDLPWVSPFLQVTKGVGEFDAFTVGAGLEVSLRERSGPWSAPDPMRFAVTPYLANNIVGDVQSGRIGAGLSLAFHPWEHFGFELDGELHGHFFRDEDVAELAPEGVDLDTKAALLSASAVARYCWASPSYGAWCPYATAGAGAIHAWFDGTAHAPGSESFAKAQTDPTLTGGVGITHLFTRHVGLRVDARYFRALVDASAPDGGYFEDYGFLRLAAGVSVGFR